MRLQFGDELVESKSDLQNAPILGTEKIDLAEKPVMIPTQPETNSESSPQKIIPIKSEKTVDLSEKTEDSSVILSQPEANTQFPEEPIDIPAIGESQPEIEKPIENIEEKKDDIENIMTDETEQIEEEPKQKKEPENKKPEKIENAENDNLKETIAKVGVSKFFLIGLIIIIVLSALSYGLILTPLGMYVGLIPDNSVTTTTVYSYSPENNEKRFEFGVTTAPESEELSTELTRDAQRKRDLENIKKGLDVYFLANNNYPISSGEEKISTGSDTGLNLVSTYIDLIALDPRVGEEFNYIYKSNDGIKYELKARLENGEDPAGVIENGLIYYKLANN